MVLVFCVAVSILLCITTLCYISITLSHIKADMRIIGFIADKLIYFKDQKKLIKLSKHSPSMPIQLHKDIERNDIWIKTQSGQDLRLVVLKRKQHTPNATAVLWLHGGGYAIQKPEQDLGSMQKFVLHNGAVVIAPDYTLSVVAPYPRGLEDCYDSLLWIQSNAQTIGVNKNQIFVAGGSAGGGLTAALTLLARDRKEVSIAFQIPLYPMVDYTNIPRGTEKRMLIWDVKRNEIAWKVYLGEHYESPKIPEYASPLYANDFSNLPPMYTFVGIEDPFYEETITYASRLKEAGVSVEYKTYEGAYHAFDIVAPYSKTSKQAWADLFVNYDYAVEHYFTK